MARGALTLQDAKQFLFFTRTANGRQAGHEFLQRLNERKEGRDKATSLPAFRTQLKAVHRWGLQEPTDLSTFPIPHCRRTGRATGWCGVRGGSGQD